MLTAAELIEFEDEVVRRFEAKEIHGPIHLNSHGQADPLIEIFAGIKRDDWVLGTWRSHWHALLHGVPRDRVMAEIVAGRSMLLHFPEYLFMTSAIVCGMPPIACGLAAAGKTVWCFVGDMCASIGAFRDAQQLNYYKNLGVNFLVEDNGLSTNTPTKEAWGGRPLNPYDNGQGYYYKRTRQHCGTDTFVSF